MIVFVAGQESNKPGNKSLNTYFIIQRHPHDVSQSKNN